MTITVREAPSVIARERSDALANGEFEYNERGNLNGKIRPTVKIATSFPMVSPRNDVQNVV